MVDYRREYQNLILLLLGLCYKSLFALKNNVVSYGVNNKNLVLAAINEVIIDEVRSISTDQSTANIPIDESRQSKSNIMSFLKLSSSILTTVAMPQAVSAARGAFELDTEIYIRNLFGLPMPEKRSVIYPSPRKLNVSFASDILSLVYSTVAGCMRISPNELIRVVNIKMPKYLEYFKISVPIVSESLEDQYYYDILLYAVYLEAGSIVNTSEDRVKMRQAVGDAILRYLEGTNDIERPSKHSTELNRGKNSDFVLNRAKSIIAMSKTIETILQLFYKNGMISGYKIDAENIEDEEYLIASFKEV